jgi:hypothetical protein
MAKLSRFLHKLADVLDDVLAYILTVAGIIASNYLPIFQRNEPLDIQVGWYKLALAALIAFVIVGRGEHLDADEDGTKTRSRIGRRKRFWSRMANAVSQGFMWAQLTGGIQ